MKIGKKSLKIIIAAVVIAMVAVVVFKFINPSSKAKIITTSTLREIIVINELSTGAFYFNGVVSVPEKDNPDKVDYSIKYNSTVKAGIKDEIDFKIDRKNKTITPIIPEIIINDVIIEIILQRLIQGYKKLKGTPLQGMMVFAG